MITPLQTSRRPLQLGHHLEALNPHTPCKGPVSLRRLKRRRLVWLGIFGHVGFRIEDLDSRSV